MPSQFDLRPGLTLGRNYYIVEYLGGGWEGEVYKVEERRTGIIRAAKIFYKFRRPTERQLKKYAQKMFRLRNCKVITQYIHRDVARIKRESVEILVSDFVDGEILSKYLTHQPRKRMGYFEAMHLLYALASGVEQIHYLGEYHGDIHSDNIMVRRRGMGFDVYLIDFFDLGRASKEKIQYDVYDLISILYEAIGGKVGYMNAGEQIHRIISGRKHSLIQKKYKNAGQLRQALENLEW